MKGWIKLHRQILENIELMNDDTAYIVFTKLLLLANNKGEIGESGRKLADKLNIKHATLYKTLKRLESYQMVKQSSKQRYTVICICNWDSYQETSKHYGKQLVNTRETAGKQTTGVARIENKNKEKGNDFRGIESPAKERIREMLKQKAKHGD